LTRLEYETYHNAALWRRFFALQQIFRITPCQGATAFDFSLLCIASVAYH
jgi:hypothetical protein